MDRQDHFDFIVLTQAGRPDPRLAIAGSRAGAIGVLNLEFSRDVETSLALLRTLHSRGRGRFGIQIGDNFTSIIDALAEKRTLSLDVVILAGVVDSHIDDAISRVHAINSKAIVVVTTLAQALSAEQHGADAVIARGHEAGGWVGDETSFVLLQRLRTQIRIPLWLHGGIGLHSVAAAAAGGATGAVLDSQLLLSRESPLPDQIKARISSMDGSETICLGASLGAGVRVYSRPGLSPLDDLRATANDLMIGQSTEADTRTAWHEAVNELVGWEDVNRQVLVVGQDAYFARYLADRFVTVGGIIGGLRESISSHLESAIESQSLAEGAPLAQSHGTRYPIVQGPMTRVSDRAAFAEAVAEAGGLPFVALALMRGPDVEELLNETAKRLGDRPWGVGILGFVPPELREEQLDVIRKSRPPFALIAGGRPDQARRLEQDGTATYLHVPSPGLLRMYLNDGARRFVFEGRECGGHVGPRTSFVLWDTMVDVLLNDLPKGVDPSTIHVLFAGAIHDGVSAAMVSSLAGPLSKKGFRIGVLVGSAYLYTNEAVASGAITEGFQRAAIDCEETILLESGPGHATRCVPSPFAEDFNREKHRLLQKALAPEQVRVRLEELNIGRLRIASKGVDRNPDYATDPKSPKLVRVKPEDQWSQGMYMIGQVAALRGDVCSMPALHEQISAGSTQHLARLAASVPEFERSAPAPCDVAIVGIGCIVPGAPDMQTFWANVLNKVDAITEIPAKRWDWRQYYDPDRSVPDKIYSKWGGFIDDVPFDPVSFGMPPSSLKSIEPFQLLALLVVRAALEDAGMMSRPFPRERTSVMLGAGGGGGDLSGNYVVRSNLPSLFGESAEDLTADLGSALPDWTEDSFAGILMNVAAGRVANRFDFGGLNYTVDAACASSLAAIYLAVRDLETGNSDVAIAGGVDAIQNPFAFLCFAKTQALSPTGHCRTFDAEADGIAISEGFATVVMKRLADAERDGDRIYAVIRGVGGASDGRDRSLTAPRPEGQMRALHRAYAQAGYDASTVGLIEAHGTGTVAGDQAEVEALSRFFTEYGAQKQGTAIGSVKSMIGHTKAAAGVAGLIKVALALHNGVLPPTLGVSRPNPKADFSNSPLYVNSETRPWVRRSDGQPRRAGVSAFGFGGTDFHVALEEYTGDYLDEPRVASDAWPSELLIWKADSRSEVSNSVDSLLSQLDQGARPRLVDLAYTFAVAAADKQDARVTLAIVADSIDDLISKLRGISEHLARSGGRIHLPSGVHYSDRPLKRDGKVAFLFPGQGSQYVNMGRDLAVMFPEVRTCFEQADEAIAGQLDRPLSRYIFPPPTFTPEEQKERQSELTETNVAQPALGATSLALLQILRSLEIEPDVAAGHSYGELVALHAAGSFDERTLLQLSEARGRFMREGAGNDAGTMAAVEAGADELSSLVDDFGVTLANLNTQRQTVISGSQNAVDRAATWCTEHKFNVRRLPVACAFHSPLVAAAQQRFGELLAETAISAPEFPVFSNTTGQAHPDDPAAIASTLQEHLISPVRWVDEIESMYAAGARLFVEVGPRSVLSGLVGQILDERPHVRVILDQPRRNGVTQLLHGLATLAAEGVDFRTERLFRGRKASRLNLSSLLRDSGTPALSATTWLINGGRAIPAAAASEEQPKVPIQVKTVSQGDAPPSPMPTDNGSTVGDKHTPAEPHLNGSNEESIGNVPSGFLKRNGGVSEMDSAPKSPLGSRLDDDDVMVRGPDGSHPGDGSEDVMAMFQQVMQRFLDTQRSVMLAYLGGSAGAERRAANPSLPVGRNGRATQRMRSNERANVASPLPTPVKHDAIHLVEPERPTNGREDEIPTNGREHHVPPGVDRLMQATPAADLHSDGAMTSEPVTDANPVLSREVLLEMLLQIVSDRTGYPTEMLAVDADLEADLGIDSIKRVEISGTIIQELKLPPDVIPDLERLTSSRTLNQVVDTLLDMVPGPTTTVSASPEEGTRPFDSAPDGERIGRFLLTTTDAPALNSNGALAKDGVIVIVDDETGVGDRLAQALVDLGHRTVRVVSETPPSGAENTIVIDIEQPAELLKLGDQIHEGFGRVCTLIHLPALSNEALSSGFEVSGWRQRRARNLDSLFVICQQLRDDLEFSANHGGSAVLVATSLGGAFGSVIPTDGIRASDGALSGFVKTLAQEWTGVRARTVDFDQSDPDSQAETLLAELFSDGDSTEIAYVDNRRVGLSLVQDSFTNDGDDPLDDRSVVLITGGARGITAEVAVTLAQRYRSMLVLVGRTPQPDDAEAEYARGLTDRTELRRAVIAHFRNAGEAPSVRVVEREVNRIIGEREVRENLKRIRDTGARVAYMSCDVRDETKFGALIDRIYSEYGRIDGVVHGAGIIEDKLIQDKQPASFDRVISTKVDSALTLAGKLRSESLRFLVFFGSVSGRFGNRGQADYAAANEILNKLACSLDRDWPGRVVSINWGPWLKTGMVSPEVQRQFAERKITLIPLSVGCQMLDEELRCGKKGEAEVVIGGTDNPDAMAKIQRPERFTAHQTADLASFPLLSVNSTSLPDDGGTVSTSRTFDVEVDRYLDHHRLDGRPVLPFAFAAELMAEAAASAFPNMFVSEVRDIRLLNGLTFDQNAKTVHIAVENSDKLHLPVPTHSVNVAVGSAELPGRLHYRSKVLLGDSPSALVLPDPLPALIDPRPFPMPVEAAYRDWLFHGPVFQRIMSIERIDSSGATAWLRPSSPMDALRTDPNSRWIVDPILVDGAFQMQVIWARMHWDVTLLPAEVGAIHRFSEIDPIDGPIRYELRIRSDSLSPLCHADHYFFNRAGNLVGRLENVVGAGSRELNRLAGSVR